MSSKDKESNTFNRLKQFFRNIKGGPGNSRTRVDFALTPELERELSSETQVKQRCEAIKAIRDDVLTNRLEDRTIEKLWHCIRDLLGRDQPRELRHVALKFLKDIVQGQYDQLALLRGHFFRVVQNHDIAEDAVPRLELLQQLTENGKVILYFEEEVGPFLLQWLPGLTSAGLTEPLLALMVNLIKFNATYLDQDVVAGIVQNTCYLCCYSSSTETVLGSLDVLDTIVCYAIFPQDSLGVFIGALCRTVNVESYCQTSWKIMRNLLGTHLGHSALYSMCRVLQDPNARSDGGLLRGAVFHINMGLWGTKKVSSLKCSASSVLPSFLQALSSEHPVVTYEVTLSIQRLINKYGCELSEPAWDLVMDIMLAIAKHIISAPPGSSLVKTHFHETLDSAENLLSKGQFSGSSERLYNLIEFCALQRSDTSVLRLMTYLANRVSPTRSMWFGELTSLMETFYLKHPRTDIRLKSLEILGAVITANRSAYEEELIERVVVPVLGNLSLEPDNTVRNSAGRLLVELCLACESKRCIELLDILEKLLNRPFELYQLDGSTLRSESDMADLRTVVNGLIKIFLSKMHQLPSSHAIRVFTILIGHVEQHYNRPIVLNASSFTRFRIFDCFLRTRANSSYHIGYPDANKVSIIKYSPYLSVERTTVVENTNQTRAVLPGTSPPPNSSVTANNATTTTVTYQQVTCVSIKKACKLIVTCLCKEKDWEVLHLVLQELPQVLQNKALVLSRNANDIDLLASTLCAMITDKNLALPDSLRNTPPKLTRSDFHSFVLPCISALAPYHQYLEMNLQQRLIRCIVRFGLVTRCARQCVTALTVLTLEMREAMVRLLPEVLLDLSKMSATVHIAVPILEFLSTLTRLPKIFANFVGDQYMSVFAISLPYTNPFRYNHYTVSLAHHVIAVWFLKCRLPFRKDFVRFITKGLKANILIPFEEGRILKQDYVSLNEDSSNRKRSSSLTEQGSRRRERPVIPRPVGDLRPPIDESLLSFHIELTETCVDLMARYTFSPCSALPKRLPTADWLLTNGQSMTWLLGHKLVTVTTSGCSQNPLRHGLCDRCLTACKNNKEVPTSPDGLSDLETKRYNKTSLQHSKSGGEMTSGDNHQSLNNKIGRQHSADSKVHADDQQRRRSDPENAVGHEHLGKGDGLHQSQDTSQSDKGSQQSVPKKIDNLLGVREDRNRLADRQSCACWCQGWAEVYVRRPTGDMSWVMRIQNQVNYDTPPNNEFPLNDITSLFIPSVSQYQDTETNNTIDSESTDFKLLSIQPTQELNDNNIKEVIKPLTNSSSVATNNTTEPINIPGSPARQLSNSSTEDTEQDIEFDDHDQDSRLRNPVRRVNSSPEMSSSWKNQFLNRDRSNEKQVNNETAPYTPTEFTQENVSNETPTITPKATTPNKVNKGYSKDMRVSCEAIPEEMSGGNTPPSHSHPALMTLHSDPGSVHNEPSQIISQAHSNTVPCTPTTTSAPSTTLTSHNPQSSKLMSEIQKISESHQQNETTLKFSRNRAESLKNSSLDMRKLTSKPPQAPVPTSPRSAREYNIERSGSNLKLPLSERTLTETPDDAPRGRSKTISVMSPVRNSRDSLKWPNNQHRGKESTPRSGINPSFVFLQLYHTAQFGSVQDKPILVGQQGQTAIKILDLIPPFETHKVGVLYVGPGQCNNETEILKNRFGSLRYTEFLRNLGTLVSLEDAPKQSLFLDLERNGRDGKFAYVWQDDVMQVTFHVATLMPNKENDPLCNEKKKHIGNDYVSIVYNESGEEYQMQTIKGQFTYACIIVQPLELHTNRVIVRARDELADLIGHLEPKIISDSNVAILARQLALHANLASMISRSLITKSNVPYASNWLERLRKIKHLRNKLVQDASPPTDGTGGNYSQSAGNLNASNAATEENLKQRKFFMEDFTDYT